MIIWLNGAFGAGKTTVASALCQRLPGSFCYDPENAGFFIRKNLPPPLLTGDFQDYPMWRAFNLDMLTYIARQYDGCIIVPMTVTSRAYYDELIGPLSRNFDLRHIILYAGRETLLKRLASRLEGRRSWGAQQIDRCIRAFDTDITEIKLATDSLTVGQAAERAAEIAGVPLIPDRRGPLRRSLHRLATQCRHIRLP